MRMDINASNYTTRRVLSIECADGRWRLVAYLSKFLNETEQNHEIHDKEMLAVIRGLEVWRHLLKDTKFKFEVWTNHKNLEQLKHMPRVRIRKADGLSRRLDLKMEVENNNKNQNLIKEEWIREIIEVVVERLKIILVEKIKMAREKNKEVVKFVEEIKKTEVKALRENK